MPVPLSQEVPAFTLYCQLEPASKLPTLIVPTLLTLSEAELLVEEDVVMLSVCSAIVAAPGAWVSTVKLVVLGVAALPAWSLTCALSVYTPWAKPCSVVFGICVANAALLTVAVVLGVRLPVAGFGRVRIAVSRA